MGFISLSFLTFIFTLKTPSMRLSSKSLVLSVIVLILIVVNYIACNKDNNLTSKTIIKCVSCANGGSCINDTCRCPAGFEGTSCQTESILKFTESFEWIVSESGSVTGPENSYTLDIEQNGSSLTSVLVYDLYEPYYFFSSSSGPLTANINGDSIFIPTQAIDSGYITGKGCYFANPGGASFIKFRYKVTNTITGVTNDFGYTNPADSPSVWTQN